uniref:Uncharacterized protein n=1 Tax=Sinocyclocheilus anshuiensis TaxID=1608454 RepID=A0A671MKU5_9TELE
MSSRALSHDSIFITEQTPSTEPTRVLSQKNVHGKIKALQVRKWGLLNCMRVMFCFGS